MVISSWVIHSSESLFDKIKTNLTAIPNIEITDEQDFKLAAVIETKSTAEAADLASHVRGMEGVNGLDIVSHFFEDETLDKKE
ncbi:MAG: chaperone NapD [candidate division Zixibacteria bacterium]|nr:chaperone NapD [candidate division Zixibacteria bacterium]